MSSRRLLRRLDARIRTATSQRAADCLRCERSAHLARLGHFDAARSTLSAVRERHAAAPDRKLTLSVWLHFADALVAHYTNLGPDARDKLARAHALSRATAVYPLQALCAAWLAHLESLRMNAEATARLVAEALAHAAPDHHATLARVKLVIAQTCHGAGRFDRARPWYDEVRRHAAAEGDDATLAALMCNMAWLRLANLRQAECCAGTVAVSAADQAWLSAESSANFDAMIGLGSLPSLQPILKAQILTVAGRTDRALALYDSHIEGARADGLGHMEGIMLADQAWCQLRAGRRDEAVATAAAAAECLSRPGQPGDRAAGHSRLAQVYEALGDATEQASQRGHSARSWKRHIDAQAEMLAALDAALTESVVL